MPILHRKVSPFANTGNSNQILPSDWNDSHVVSGVVDFTGNTGITFDANFFYNPSGQIGPYLSVGTSVLTPSYIFAFKTTSPSNAAEALIFGDYQAPFDGIHAPIGTQGLVINTGTNASQNCPGVNCNPFIGHIIGVVGNAQETNSSAQLTAIGVEGRADNIQSTTAGQQHYSGVLAGAFKTFSGTNNQTMKGLETVLQSCNSTTNTFTTGGPNNDLPGGHLVCSSLDNNGTGIAVHITPIQGFATKWGIYSDVDPAFIGGKLQAASFSTVSNCNPGSSVSPTACGSAPSGTVVVPTTTTTYTVNTTAVTASSRIIILPITDNSGLTGSPTCNVPPTPFIAYQSARVAGTSFTFTLPSTTGTSCWTYSVTN